MTHTITAQIMSLLLAAALSGIAAIAQAPASANADVVRSPAGTADVVPYPVTARVQLSAAEARTLTVHIPPGTNVRVIGKLAEGSPAIVAWYEEKSKRLVSAIELRLGDSIRSGDSITVTAGRNEGGCAPAVFRIHTTQSEGALLRPEGAVSVSPAGNRDRYNVAPLLSYAGSSTLLGLAGPLPNDVLRSQQFGVQAKDRLGRAYTATLPSQGGQLPVNLSVPTSRPNVPSPLQVRNPNSAAMLVNVRPISPVKWADTGSQEIRAVQVPPLGVASPGRVVSPAPGQYPVRYEETPLPALGSQPLTNGPIAVESERNTTLNGIADSPVGTVTSSNPRIPVTVQTPTASRSDTMPFALAVGATAAAGVTTLAITTHKRNHEEQVTIVPMSQADLEQQDQFVEITAISTPGLLDDVAPTVCPKERCCVLKKIEVRVGGSTKGNEITKKFGEKLKEGLEKEPGEETAGKIGEVGGAIIAGYDLITKLARPWDLYATLVKGEWSCEKDNRVCKGEEKECRVIPRDKTGKRVGMPGGIGGSENEAWPPNFGQNKDWWSDVGKAALERALQKMLEKCECDDGTKEIWPPPE